MALIEKKVYIKNDIDYEKIEEIISDNAQNFEIDYGKLAEAIVKANNDAEEERKKRYLEQADAENAEFLTKIGVKEIPENENKLKRKWRSFCNNWHYFLTFIFYKQEYATSPIMTFEIMKMVAGFFLGIIEKIFFILGIVFMVVAFKYTNVADIISIIIMGLILFVISRFFRISKLEVNNIQEQETITSIYSSIISFISLVMATIAAICAYLALKE